MYIWAENMNIPLTTGKMTKKMFHSKLIMESQCQTPASAQHERLAQNDLIFSVMFAQHIFLSKQSARNFTHYPLQAKLYVCHNIL